MLSLLIPFGLIGCKLADTNKVAAVPKSCPDGAELKGAPPPDGSEIWCEKDVGGVPVWRWRSLSPTTSAAPG